MRFKLIKDVHFFYVLNKNTISYHLNSFVETHPSLDVPYRHRAFPFISHGWLHKRWDWGSAVIGLSVHLYVNPKLLLTLVVNIILL